MYINWLSGEAMYRTFFCDQASVPLDFVSSFALHVYFFSKKSRNIYLTQIEFLYSSLVPLGKCVTDFVLPICFIS